MAVDVSDLASALHQLGLDQFLPKFHKPLGVQELAEINELEVEDLEEIGLTRLQVRRLQAAAKTGKPAPASRMSPPALAVESKGRQTHSQTNKISRQRSPSHDGSRRRSSSRVSFRSVSSAEGYEFEQNCRTAILSWLQSYGYGQEVSPKALGIQQHDCDLVIRLNSTVSSSQLLPPMFKAVTPRVGICRDQSLIFFEVKSRARRVDRAIEQLRTRQALLEASERQHMHLVAIVALSDAQNPEYQWEYQALQEAAHKNPDVDVTIVDADALAWDDTEHDLEVGGTGTGDTEEALAEAVRKALSSGPVNLVTLASGLGFAKRYNELFHGGKRVNNGSWTAWLQSLPGVTVEHEEGKAFKPTTKVWLTNSAQRSPNKEENTASRGRSLIVERRAFQGSVHSSSRRASSRPRVWATKGNSGKADEASAKNLFEKTASSSKGQLEQRKAPISTKKAAYFERKLESEDRVLLDDEFFHGTIQIYKPGAAFGYLSPDEPDTLPDAVQAALRDNKKHGLYFRGTDVLKLNGSHLARGSYVRFQVYTDNHSAGACNITFVQWKAKPKNETS